MSKWSWPFFFTKDALSVWTELGQTFVVRLVMRLKNKDNHNTHYMGADEPSFVVRRSKCITKDEFVSMHNVSLYQRCKLSEFFWTDNMS